MSRLENPFPSGAVMEQALAEMGHAYAWGGTARRIVLPAIETLRARKKGIVTIVDICSAYPILAEFLREEIRQLHYIEASKLLSRIFDGATEYIPGLPDSKDWHLPDLDRKPQPGSLSRLLLTSALYRTTDMFAGYECDPKVLEYFESMLRYDETVTAKGRVLRTNGQEGSWNILKSYDAGFTAVEAMQAEGMAAQDITRIFTGMRSVLDAYLPGMSKVNIHSLDLGNKPELIHEAGKSFPPHYLDTESYLNAAQFHGHVQADVLHLPFEPESVDMLLSIEGAPFYVAGETAPDTVRFGRDLSRVLAPGGSALFFPWAVHNKSEEAKLRVLQNALITSGLVTWELAVKADRIIARMSSREQALVTQSPIFAGVDEIVTLSAQKPTGPDLIPSKYW